MAADRHTRTQTLRASLLSGTIFLLSVMNARAGDASTGMEIAKHGTSAGAPACVGCHGVSGEGNVSAGFPRLAGLSAAYLSEQMAAFASGERQSPIMSPIAKTLTLEERVALVNYLSNLRTSAAAKPEAGASVTSAQTGAWIATRGRWDTGLPACAQCHGPRGAGVGASFPPLAGQPASYLARQLHNWKNGTRPPGPMALMQVVASKLSDADIAAVAGYYGAQTGVPTGDPNGSHP